MKYDAVGLILFGLFAAMRCRQSGRELHAQIPSASAEQYERAFLVMGVIVAMLGIVLLFTDH